MAGNMEHDDDNVSQLGELFTDASKVSAEAPRVGPAPAGGVDTRGVVRDVPVERKGYGKGLIPHDARKFRYDRLEGRSMPALSFGTTRVDRMDPEEAGDLLDKIHRRFGIDREAENVLEAFDKALFFEHAVNGASMLQSGRGELVVGDSRFEIAVVKTLLGVDQRRFFRAFADDVTAVVREVLAAYDPYSPGTVDRHGQVMQLAVEKGLQKYPHLIHDSADAGARLSVEERAALVLSKKLVLESSDNSADRIRPRVDERGMAARDSFVTK